VNGAPCAVYPEAYETQLADKTQNFVALMADLDVPEPQVFASPSAHFRMRVEFRMWREEGRLWYVMFDVRTKQRVLLETCPVACEPIAQLMPKLLADLREDPILNHKLFAIEFLANSTGDVLVTLIYHRPLDEAWDVQAQHCQTRRGIGLIGRARNTCRVLRENWVVETLKVAQKTYRYQQIEGSFTQPNARVNEQMLHWALTQAEGRQGDLLELYCGNGNFTCVLAQAFDKVLATEISKTSVASALHNFALNGVENVQIARMASEELTQALQGVRVFRRLQGIDLQGFSFSTVLVDPPRAGLDEATLQLVAGFECILYISCNPQTLSRDLRVLSNSHRILASAVFDQFPYTEHLESGVWLVKR